MRPLFENMGLRLGNVPIGVWALGDLEGDSSRLVEKFISVMQTFGDRRLETHLLGGLEQIVTRIEIEKVASGVTAVMEVYTSRGAIPPGDATDRRSFVKVSHLQMHQIWDALEGVLGTLSPSAPGGLSDEALDSVGLLPTEIILSALTGDPLRLVRLYGRLGWEAGRALAGVHRSGYLWGTFCDHGLFDLHCNAHPDNLIVLPIRENISDYQLIAPVDFDMSFAKDQAVSVWTDPPEPDPSYVTSQFASELEMFVRFLSGMTAVIPGVSTGTFARKQPEDANYNTLLWIGRDVAAYEALKAYLDPSVDRSGAIGLTLSDAAPLVLDALEVTHHQAS
jgi:hypothetical protein